MKPSSLFSFADHLEKLRKDGGPFEVLNAMVEFECFQTRLVEQAQNNLSDAKMGVMIRDRL